MLAAQALGGVPVPMYQDAPAAEFVYVLNDASIVYAIAEDQEQVDKLVEAMPTCPRCATSITTTRAGCVTTRGS
jgi:long-chain acyl-CoA synthetase